MESKKFKKILLSSAALAALAGVLVESQNVSAQLLSTGTQVNTKVPATKTNAVDATEPLAISEVNFPDPIFRSYLKAFVAQQGETDLSNISVEILNERLGYLDFAEFETGDQLKDLTGIEKLPSVSLLSLDGTQVTDLSPLNKCQSLTQIKLRDMPFTDLSALNNPTINYLTLGGPKSKIVTADIDDVKLPSLKDLVVNESPTLKSMKVAGKTIQNITGLDDPNLESVDTMNAPNLHDFTFKRTPKLASVDVSNNLVLHRLTVSGSAVSTIDVSKNEPLNELEISSSNLTSLDISNNPKMQFLNVNDNQITSIALPQENSWMGGFEVANNKLTEVDTAKMQWLQTINIAGNQITELNYPLSVEITTLNVSGNPISSLAVDTEPLLIHFYADDTKLSEISFENQTKLKTVSISNNNFTGILDLGVSYLTEFHAENTHFAYAQNEAKGSAFKGSPAGEDFHGTSTIDGTAYQAEGKWHVDLKELIGADVDFSYIRATEGWTLEGSILTYEGDDEPKEVVYDVQVQHNAIYLPDTFVAQYPVTVNLEKDVNKKVNVSFTSGDDSMGTVDETPVPTPVGEVMDPAAVPVPAPLDGYVFDHWEDYDQNVVDLTTFKPMVDVTLFAVFAEAEETETSESSTDSSSTDSSSTEESSTSDSSSSTEESSTVESSSSTEESSTVESSSSTEESSTVDSSSSTEESSTVDSSSSTEESSSEDVTPVVESSTEDSSSTVDSSVQESSVSKSSSTESEAENNVPVVETSSTDDAAETLVAGKDYPQTGESNKMNTIFSAIGAMIMGVVGFLFVRKNRKEQ